jgi:hypothetical protein
MLVLAPAAHAEFDGIFNGSCQGVSDSSVCNDQSQGQSPTNNSIYGPNGILTKVANLLALVIGIAAVIVIIIAGIRFITSGGDATKVATAKSTILYAIVGLAVAALARAIVIFVLNRL